jgi:fumarylacetoacetate (FAA) hydrolase family protein
MTGKDNTQQDDAAINTHEPFLKGNTPGEPATPEQVEALQAASVDFSNSLMSRYSKLFEERQARMDAHRKAKHHASASSKRGGRE